MSQPARGDRRARRARSARRALVLLLATVLVPGAAHAADRETPLIDDAAWTIYTDPTTVATSRGTYVASVRSNGDVEAVRLSRGSMSVQHAVLEPRVRIDDHASPAIVAAEDGRVGFFWSGHGREPVHYRLTGTDGSLSHLGALRTLRGSGIEARGATYAQVVRVTGARQPYHLFVRLDDNNWWMVRSADLVTWSPAVRLTTDPYPQDTLEDAHQLPYVEVAGGADGTLHIAMTSGYTTDGDENSLYAFVLEDGAIRRADGRVLRTAWQVDRMGRGSAPLSPLEGTPLTPPAGERRVQVFDISVVDGTPYIASATEVDAEGFAVNVATGSPDGTGPWVSEGLTRTVRRPGSISLDHARPRTAYLSLPSPVDPTGPGVVLHRWSSPAPGKPWQGTVVTQGAPQVWTPRSVIGAEPGPYDPRLLWLSGTKTDFAHFDLTVMATTGTRVPVTLEPAYEYRPTGWTRVDVTVRRGVRGPGASGLTLRAQVRRPGSATWSTVRQARSAADGTMRINLPPQPLGTRLRLDAPATPWRGAARAPSRTLVQPYLTRRWEPS